MGKEVIDLSELTTQIMTAELNPNVGLKLFFDCKICGERFTNLERCLEGLDYVPPDPFPEGTSVVDTRWGTVGVVARSEVICTTMGHIHWRVLEVQPNHGGGRNDYYIRKDEGRPAHLVSKEEWEARQANEQ